MKKLLLISVLSLSLVGCAFLQHQKSAVEACLADVECKAQAEAWQEKGEVVGTIAGGAIPVGGSAAPKVVGYTFLGVALLILGNKLLKKKETPPTQ